MPKLPSPARMRVFFALWPGPEVIASLQPWMHAAHECCGGRAVRDDTLHMTLAFLGDIDAGRVQALVDGTRARAIAPGELALTRYGSFTRPRIVWCGPADDSEGSAQVTRLSEALWSWLAPLGFERSQEGFQPHVTLLRKADTEVLPLATPAPIAWSYSRYVLISSEQDISGRHYRILAQTR